MQGPTDSVAGCRDQESHEVATSRIWYSIITASTTLCRFHPTSFPRLFNVPRPQLTPPRFASPHLDSSCRILEVVHNGAVVEGATVVVEGAVTVVVEVPAFAEIEEEAIVVEAVGAVAALLIFPPVKVTMEQAIPEVVAVAEGSMEAVAFVGAVEAEVAIMKIEEQTMAALIKAPRAAADFPPRPGFGTQGKAITLFANYFDLMSVGKTLCRYDLQILEDKSARKPTGKKLKQIVRLLIGEHFAHLRSNIVTDFTTTLISQIKLLEEGEDARIYEVRYRDEKEDDYPEQPMIYRVKCQYTGNLDPSDLLNYLTSTKAADMFKDKAEILQAMNIVLGHQPKGDPNIYSVGANRHFAIDQGHRQSASLGAGLEALRGFFVSVRAATARILVNVQVRYVACYKDRPLKEVLGEYLSSQRFNFSDTARFLKNLQVRVIHIERKNKRGDVVPRIKRIAGLATPRDGASLPNPPIVPRPGAGPDHVQFWLDARGQQPTQQSSKGKGKKPVIAGPAPAGRYISVAAFFAQQYKITVDYNMPVVNVGDRQNPSYLPVEVCHVEPGQQAKMKLSPGQTSAMLGFAVRRPPQNARSIVEDGAQVLGLGGASNETLAEFGIRAASQLITVPGRVLAAPNVHYKDLKAEQKLITVIPESGSWNMRSIRFSKGSALPRWAWLFLDDNPNGSMQPDEMNACLKKFHAKLREVGVAANPPLAGRRIHLPGGATDESTAQREALISRAVREMMDAHKPTMILGVLPSRNNTDVYNCIKRVCDIREGVLNVNVLVDNFKRGSEQTFANVGLKVNLKLGGANQLIPPSELGIVGKNDTMLVGIDVTHPSPGSSSKAPSVAGMVASIDSDLGQWPAELRIQAARQERVDDLETMLKAHLGRWARHHQNKYPKNIIIYRDGVSEGQYEMVVQQELRSIKKACNGVYPATETAKGLPRISVIVVGKRHHTRFYPTRAEDADGSLNTPNGTVVDRGVTEVRNWDFYLQAHKAIKGTARPAHYFIVWDEIFCKETPKAPQQNAADILESLTHRLCYLFGRATMAVSICPPAYYADLVCERARCYLSDVFDATSTGSIVTGTEGGAVAPDGGSVTIHPNVKDKMFYI
ncbi:putative RNA interference and gene silencing protein (Qde2) [Aspergillus homomorphus CBS 101889]|uniref:Piwi-domain-containing protein n=1 Tax=Aspergillus homomorphus (strain CBS 101889) TaxID=1450537 RepID=A0A395IC00_ASPHC|nr:Piwi-domain-containing protein [Aspergillus homomorphus CBS 101889]RAL16618.1 Piwi-domain-containing protein [Aspergillus homomorphus CBS 101889]